MKLFELIDLDSARKQIDSDEMRKRVVKAGGNPFDTKVSKIARKIKNVFKKK